MGDVINLPTAPSTNANDNPADTELYVSVIPGGLLIQQHEAAGDLRGSITVTNDQAVLLASDIAWWREGVMDFVDTEAFDAGQWDELSDPVYLSSLLNGEHRIGVGRSRQAFTHPTIAGVVLKVATSRQGIADNFNEWTTWRALRDHEAGQWLAPVLVLSRSGTFLLQRQTIDVGKIEGAPPPAWLGDMPAENFGTLDGRVVCHGYSRHRLLAMGLEQAALRSALLEDRAPKVAAQTTVRGIDPAP